MRLYSPRTNVSPPFLDVSYAPLVVTMLAACCEKVGEMPLSIYVTSRKLAFSEIISTSSCSVMHEYSVRITYSSKSK